MALNTDIPAGWQCPRCSRCYSPMTSMCGFCVPATKYTTTASGFGSYCEMCYQPLAQCKGHITVRDDDELP